jgi:hypothetical protein
MYVIFFLTLYIYFTKKSFTARLRVQNGNHDNDKQTAATSQPRQQLPTTGQGRTDDAALQDEDEEGQERPKKYVYGHHSSMQTMTTGARDVEPQVCMLFIYMHTLLLVTTIFN